MADRSLSRRPHRRSSNRLERSSLQRRLNLGGRPVRNPNCPGLTTKNSPWAIDTTTSGGKLIFHIFGALAEFERDIIRERTQAGLQAARARGRLGGRSRAAALNTPKKIALAQSLYNDTNNTIEDICKTLHISRATLYRYVKTK